MPEEEFWAIIEATTKHEADTDRQAKALAKELNKLSAAEIESFESAFGAQLKRSYTWDLWGADYVAHGGASDDSFEYFRRWLISKGREIFEHVLADPDSLADMLAEDSEGVLEFEEFAYVAREVWSKKTGKPASEIPIAAGDACSGLEPAGTPFDEDALETRYPKLWKRFGENPLS